MRMASQEPAFDDRDGWIWFDGEMVPWREAETHVLTHGLHYASSVFEGQRAYNGEIFKLTEHSERLRNSAAILGFELPWSVDEINAACKEVLKANGLGDAYMRPVAWRGARTGNPTRRAVAARKANRQDRFAGRHRGLQ
jgi:branched-chain amino acid aminotransferase